MTKGDIYAKEIIKRILEEGTLDENPRPVYRDGTPAHTLSYNHGMCTYDLTKNESPIITLRPIAVESSIGELLWIYRDADNNIYNLEKNYGVRWWREWCVNPMHYSLSGDLLDGPNPFKGYYFDSKGNMIEIGKKSSDVDPKTDIDGNKFILDSNLGNVLTNDANLGYCYGGSVREHDLFNTCLKNLKEDPFSRRNIINLWQDEDFKKIHGIKPCAFLTEWNVRKVNGTYYLDMCLTQRSSDFIVAGCINQVQYMTFLCMMARELGYEPGRFTWFYNNIQIYDRHIDDAKELLSREPIPCEPKIVIDDEVKSFDDMNTSNVRLEGYPREEISKKNKQLKLEIAI